MPLHWATPGKWEWHSRQEFRLQPPRSKRGALYVELRESNEWRPRMDLHHQPPDPKAGALLFELQGSRKVEAHPGVAPGNSVLQTDGSTALPCAPAKRKWGDQWDLHPTRRLSQSRMLLLHHDLHLESGSGYRCRPGLVSFTRRVHMLLCQAGMK